MMRSLRISLALPLLLATQPAVAQDGSLQAAADAEIAKGLAAAQKQDFKAAADEFLKARYYRSEMPEISLDLALAEAQMPGYELRALAWFKLYQLQAPNAPNAAAVRTQMAAMETAYEARLNGIADGLESIMALRKTQYPMSNYKPDVADALQAMAANVGWGVAEIRFAIGDASDALAGLRRTNGSDWQRGWNKSWQTYVSEGNTPGSEERVLPTAIAAAGRLDQAYDMLKQVYDSQAAGFFLEQGDNAHAQKFSIHETLDEEMKTCPDDAAKDQADGKSAGFVDRCRAERWWSTGREIYLINIGENGVILDNAYHENQIPEYLKSQEMDTTDVQYAFQMYPMSAAARIANLALEYRQVRGPAKDPGH